MIWHKDIPIHQWSPERDPQINCQFGFNTTAKPIQWSKGKSFQHTVLEQLDVHIERINLDLTSHPTSKLII